MNPVEYAPIFDSALAKKVLLRDSNVDAAAYTPQSCRVVIASFPPLATTWSRCGRGTLSPAPKTIRSMYG